MKKVLVLHIGRHKTGTSSIQETLRENRIRLKSQGLYFPKSYYANHSITFAPLFDSRVEHKFFLKETYGLDTVPDIHNKEKKLMKWWIKQFKRFQASNCSHFIISSEDLSLATEEMIKNLKEFCAPFFDEVIIIAYYRSAQDYYCSYIQEKIRFGSAGINATENIESVQMFLPTLSLFIKYFGKESICIRRFEQNLLINQNVVVDFFDTIGFSDVIKTINIIRVNESIGKYSLSLLSNFNAQNKELANRYRFIQQSLVRILSNIDEPKNDLSIQFSISVTNAINQEYTLVNQFLSDDQKLMPLLESEQSTAVGMTALKDIPDSYWINLFKSCLYEIEQLNIEKQQSIQSLFITKIKHKLEYYFRK